MFIADIPMIVSKWSPIAEDAQPEIKTIPMWVTIKNVSNSMYFWKGLGYLASTVGEPKCLHPDTELCKNFEEAKVFVEADMSKELLKTYQLKLKQVEEVTVEFSYPWLPPRCHNCAKWRHLAEQCLTNSKQVTILKRQGTVSNPTSPLKGSDLTEKQSAVDSTLMNVEIIKSMKDVEEAVEEDVVPQEIIVDVTGVTKNSLTSEHGTGELAKQNDMELQTILNLEEQLKDTNNWTAVSPNKVGRQLDTTTSATISTTSRYSVLDEEGDNDELEGTIDAKTEIDNGEVQTEPGSKLVEVHEVPGI